MQLTNITFNKYFTFYIIRLTNILHFTLLRLTNIFKILLCLQNINFNIRKVHLITTG